MHEERRVSRVHDLNDEAASMLVALGLLGRTDEAKLAAQRILELTPEFTVSQFEHVSPHKNSEFRKRVADVYRAAGVPT